MFTRSLCHRVWMLSSICLSLLPSQANADTLRVTRPQGAVHAFLVVRDTGGAVIGTGDSLNVRSGNTWKTRLTLHFKDGSVDDETAVYQQATTIRLLTDHHIQKGPSFPKQMDMTIDAVKKTVTWHEMKDGKDQAKTAAVDVPPDTSNGLMSLVMQNLPKGSTDTKMGYIVGTPKPRVVKMAIHPDGQDHFSVAGGEHPAAKFRIHVDLGGVVGVIAPIIGKEPPDLFVWVVQGDVPTFLRMNGPLFDEGPIWTIELSSPTWPAAPAR